MLSFTPDSEPTNIIGPIQNRAPIRGWLRPLVINTTISIIFSTRDNCCGPDAEYG
jgi:hypothetical protein